METRSDANNIAPRLLENILALLNNPDSNILPLNSIHQWPNLHWVITIIPANALHLLRVCIFSLSLEKCDATPCSVTHPID